MDKFAEMVCPFNEFKPCYKHQCPFYKSYIGKSNASGYWEIITVYKCSRAESKDNNEV